VTRQRELCIAAVVSLALWSGVLPAQTPALSAADRQAIAEQMEAYRKAWLDGDAPRILALFAEDAVFMPHHGLDPVVGREALRAFWWPPGAGVTQIVRFDVETRAIEGTPDLIYAWGRQRLEWTTKDDKGLRRFRTQGNHLTVFRRTAEGWKIALQMGDDEPNERL